MTSREGDAAMGVPGDRGGANREDTEELPLDGRGGGGGEAVRDPGGDWLWKLSWSLVERRVVRRLPDSPSS